MKTNLVKILFYTFVVLVLAASLTFAQDSTKSKTSKMNMKGMQMNTHSRKQMNSAQKSDSSIKEFKGVIDLNSIDLNKDGKVYQCPMDFNVLSDKPGIDPKCGMKLKKVSLKLAKENLIKHGFKVSK